MRAFPANGIRCFVLFILSTWLTVGNVEAKVTIPSETKTVTSEQVLTVLLRPGGGFAIMFAVADNPPCDTL